MNDVITNYLMILGLIFSFLFFADIGAAFLITGFFAFVTSPILYLISKDMSASIAIGLSGLFAFIPTLFYYIQKGRTDAPRRRGRGVRQPTATNGTNGNPPPAT